jgi:hypothetical protein
MAANVHISGKMSTSALFRQLKAFPRVVRSPIELPVFKAVVNATETRESARKRWPTCQPATGLRAFTIATVPLDATIVAPRQDYGPPLFLRVNRIRILSILAPISSGGALKCSNAQGPIHNFNFVAGETYECDLDPDPSHLFGAGFHVVPEIGDARAWAEHTLGGHWINDAAAIVPWIGRATVTLPGV